MRAALTAIVAMALTAVLAAGCGAGERRDVDVPRRRAYPRMELPAESYREERVGNATVAVNEAASTGADGPGWLTATYPGGMAEIYITYTTIGADPEAEIGNRVERLSMNTGGAATEISEFVNGQGLQCILMKTPAGSPTPVQFIAVAPEGWMLSGSAMVDKLTEAPDSLAPVVEMLERDVQYMLERL